MNSTTKCNLQKEKITNIVVESPNEAVQRAKEDCIDVFVINKYLCSELHKLIDSLKQSDFIKDLDTLSFEEYLKIEVERCLN